VDRDAWIEALEKAAKGIGGGLSGKLSSGNLRKSSGTGKGMETPSPSSSPVVTRPARSRSRSEPDLFSAVGAAANAPNLMISPRKQRAGVEFDLIVEASHKYAPLSDAGAKSTVLLDLAEGLLKVNSPFRACEFATSAADLQLVRGKNQDKDLLDRAARTMQRAEQHVVTGSAHGKGQGWSNFERDIMPMRRFLANEREVLSEAISEKDTDTEERTLKFATDVYSRVLVPMVTQALAKMPKPPTKYSVVVFDMTASIEERLPYDGANIGVILHEYSDANVRFFRDLLALIAVKMAQLGETAPVLLCPNWKTGFPGLRMSTEEEFQGLELVGGVEQYLKLFEVNYEASHIYQSMMLIQPHYLHGDKGLVKRYTKEIQGLLDSHWLIPLAYTGDATYREYAVSKLPPKKKMEMFEPPQQIRRLKAAKFLGWIGNRWCGDLFMVKDHPYPKMANLKEEFHIPVFGVINALRLLHGVPADMKMDPGLDMLQSQFGSLGKRSVRHIRSMVENLRKYRLLAQLKNECGNEYLYHEGVGSKPPGAWKISGKYLEKVMSMYQTVLPIVIGADDYFHSGVLTKNTFNLENLKLETPWVHLLALQRMGLDENALTDAIALSEGQSYSMHRVVSVAENISNARAAMGDFNGALVDLGMLKEVCLDQKARKSVAAVNGKLSVVLDMAGHPDQAAKLRDQALEFMESTRTAKRDRACLEINRACQLMMSGEVDEACKIFQNALKHAKSTKNRRLHKRSMQLSLPALKHNLGTCYVMSNRADEALPLFVEEMSLLAERFGADSLDVAFCSLNLAAAHKMLGNDKPAKSFAYLGAATFCRVFGREDEHVSACHDFCFDLMK
jgi:tetratricopeptide (TPR) repeat protein